MDLKKLRTVLSDGRGSLQIFLKEKLSKSYLALEFLKEKLSKSYLALDLLVFYFYSVP